MYFFPFQETILSTPSVTPESTPSQSPPPIKESFTVKTPESSMSINEMDEDVGAIGKNTDLQTKKGIVIYM